eukprot:TRINITY_DN6124_c4_g1_i1.p1 TRINITY_DN6124_c4_g1~~TRINITY_DN6124_c4_g1_i1.p1  ORF type:complete len:1988 (+),score=769.96 TRINITY_DN6124_c4_g1_i1:42-6005(+)
MKVLRQAAKEANDLLKQEEFAKAEQHIKAVFKEEDGADRDYMLLVLLGKAQHQTGRGREAEETYRKAVAVDAQQLPAWQGLRDVYVKSGELDKALPALAEVARLAKTPEQKQQAQAKSAELVAKYDLGRLEQSTTIADYVRKETSSRQEDGTALRGAVLQLSAGREAEKLSAQDAVHARLIYGLHGEGDEALRAALTGKAGDSALPVKWVVRRGMSLVARSGADERPELLKAVADFAAASFADHRSAKRGSLIGTPGAVSYWPFRLLVVLARDAPELCPGVVDDLVHAFFDDDEDDPVQESEATSRRRNVTEEERELKLRRKIAGLAVVPGRIAIALDLETAAELYEPQGIADGGALPRNEAATAEVAPLLPWLQDCMKECPECLSAYACEAALLYRLGRYTHAAASAERGLGMLGYRIECGSLPPADVACWGRRLVSTRSLALCMLGRVPQAIRALRVAAEGELESAAPVLAVTTADIHLHNGEGEEALAALRAGGRRGEAAAAGLHCKARALLMQGELEDALKNVQTSLKMTKRPTGMQYATQGEVQMGLGADHHAACLASLLKAAELSPYLPDAFRLLGVYHRNEEKRTDPSDGATYTRRQFQECYHGYAEWVAAVPPQRRVDAADGAAYTKEEFKQCYGGLSQWDASRPAPAELPTEARLALRFFSKAVRLSPLDAEAGRSLAAMLQERGETAQLLSVCGLVTDAAEAAGGHAIGKALWAFRLVGFTALNLCKYELAAGCLKQCLRYRADDPVAACGLARAFEGQGTFARAAEHFQRAAAAGGGREARRGHASCLARDGRVQEAVQELEKAVAGPDADDAASHLILARACTRWARGGPELQDEPCKDVPAVLKKAAWHAAKAEQLSGGVADACRLRGEIAMLSAEVVHGSGGDRAEHLNEALAAYKRALSAPQLPVAEKAHSWYDLGRVHFALYGDQNDEKQRAQAESCCREAIKVLPRRAQFWILLGCCISPDLPNRRMWALARGLQLDPADFGGWCNQGWLLLLHSQPDPALLSFERAQALRPDAWQPWFGIAMALQRKAYGSMTYSACGAVEQAYELSRQPWLMLQSLAAAHFQPRQYGKINPQLAKRAEAVYYAFQTDVCALNTSGLVLEELGHLALAAKAFERGINVLAAQAPRDRRPRTVQWVSGRNSIMPMRNSEHATWKPCEPGDMRRMMCTSLLRTLCKLGEGGQPKAKTVREWLLATVEGGWGGVPGYESATRAMLCHLLACPKEVAAAQHANELLDGLYVEDATHDSIVAGVAVHNARQASRNAALVGRKHPISTIKDDRMRELTELVDSAGRALRSPGMDLRTDDAKTVAEKCLLFKVLLECGEGCPPVRFRDTGEPPALIEFRYFKESGQVRYSVDGELRKGFSAVTFGVDAEGPFAEIEEIDACVSLPRDRSVVDRLVRLFESTGVRHNLGDTAAAVPRDRDGRPVTCCPEQTAHGLALLLGMVRELTRKGLQMTHNDISDAIDVLYTFAGTLAAMPDRLPAELATDMPALLHQCTKILQRVSSDGLGISEERLHKAQYALALLCYAGASAVTGKPMSWEEVLQPDDGAVLDVDDERQAAAGGGGDDDDVPAFRTPLEGCQEIMSRTAADGYVEAATVLGLTYLAMGNYEEACRVLATSIHEHAKVLDWRRWDAHRGLVYALLLRGDFDGAEKALRDAAQAAAGLSADRSALAAVVRVRRLFAAGRKEEAAAEAERAGDEHADDLQLYLDMLAMARAAGVQDLSVPLRKVRHRVMHLSSGGLWGKNLLASLVAYEATAMLKTGADGTVLLQQAPSRVAWGCLEKHAEVWPHSVVCRQLTVQLAIMKQDPTASGAAIDSLNEGVPGSQHLPLLQFWLAHPGVLVTRDEDLNEWDSLQQLLEEVGTASLAGVRADDGDGGAHLAGVLTAIVDLAINRWDRMCPAVHAPSAEGMRGGEYREALSRHEGKVQRRAAQVRRLRRIVRAALDKLAQLRPSAPHLAARRAQFDEKV